MNCEQCEAELFDFHEGNLSEAAAANIDAHLKGCEDCSALLSDIWQMNLVSSRWQDESPALSSIAPSAASLQSPARQWQLPNVVAMAASILALVMVVTDTHITTDESGIAIRFGQPGYVTEDAMAAMSQKQSELFLSQIERVADQQVASDQLVLRTVLEASREERRDETATLVSLWSATQARQAEQTQRNFRYLLASQAEDEKDIEQLSAAFQEITLRQGSDL